MLYLHWWNILLTVSQDANIPTCIPLISLSLDARIIVLKARVCMLVSRPCIHQ